jgi:hypothetical protein
MIFPNGKTITVERPADTDSGGDPLGPPVRHDIDGVAIAPGTSSTNTDHRETAIGTVTLYCPAGADIRVGDRVKLPGDTINYAVQGIPESWESAWVPWFAGVVVEVRGVK